MKKKKPLPTWEAIASFYAGRPVTLGEDTRGPLQASSGIPESGKILLGKGLRQSLDDWMAQWNRNPKQRKTLLAGVNPLSALLHEAMHNRHFTDDYFAASNPNTGFRNAGSENQAIALGAELIPDMLHRFFGVPIDSPLSRLYAKAAKGRSEYQNVYQNPYFPPPTRNL